MRWAKDRNIPGDPRFAKDGDDYVKLSRALEYYEGLCWFPANRVLLLGVLSANDFLLSQKFGLAKDTGAGGLHGEQSHRLQWHAIMFHATSKFTKAIATESGWSHSPLEIYYELTQGAANTTIKKPQTGTRPAWGYLMDSRDNDGWGNPDNVVRSALQDNSRPMIKAAFSRRTVKIGGPRHLNPTYEQKAEFTDGSIQQAINKACSELGKQLTPTYLTLINAWRKGEKVPENPTEKRIGNIVIGTKVVADAKEIYEHLLQQKHITQDAKYSPIGENMVSLGRLEKVDSELVKRSRGALNKQYGYSTNAGAYPNDPSLV